jgi:hypothetical protein
MTRAMFLEYLEFSVVHFSISLLFFSERLTEKQMPLCSPFPGPLSVLVMDNARIHHGAGILELAEHFGTSLISHRYGLIIMHIIRYSN